MTNLIKQLTKLGYILGSKVSFKLKKSAISHSYLPFDKKCSPFEYSTSYLIHYYEIGPKFQNARKASKSFNFLNKSLQKTYPASFGYKEDLNIYSNFVNIAENIPLNEKQHELRFLIGPRLWLGSRSKKDSNLVNGKRIAIDLKHALVDYEVALVFASFYNISSANLPIYKVTMMLEGILQESLNLSSGFLKDEKLGIECNRFTKTYTDTLLRLISDVTSLVHKEMLHIVKAQDELELIISKSSNLDRLHAYLNEK